MKIDGPLLGALASVPARARQLEDLGYAGCFAFEGPHEPFMPLLLAAEHTERLDIATGLAIAFARTPMTVANLAHDLHVFSGGRLILGLGSQIKPHIERRYSCAWSKPAARMREFVQALRAIFACWNDGTPLSFEGEFYTHTLMPPMFRPGGSKYGPPRIMLGGVGPKMVEVAGEVADVMLAHPLNTPRYIEDTLLPALRRGAARTGNTVELACQTLLVTGANERDYLANREATRAQLAFYASTPAYRVVLEAEGWGELQPALRTMTKEHRWADMKSLVTDEVLDRVAVCGAPEDIPAALRARYGEVASRVAFAAPYALDDRCVRTILAGLTEP